MASWVELFQEWEIQALVVLSFSLQTFLLCTGGLRRRSKNMLLRLCMWLAYLGADFVAVYALGFLSRHDDATVGRDTLAGGTHQLSFLWAPFLLLHLGGQDTITAFAIQDNSLWLRHLLNMVVQVALALYVFWKSTAWRHMQLLLPGIFLFIAGTIKYGERILALMYGDLESISSSSSSEEKRGKLPERSDGQDYPSIVIFALHSSQAILDILAGRTSDNMSSERLYSFAASYKLESQQDPKLLDVELAMAYDDLYTKASVLRTRTGTILRCVCQVSLVAAFVLFQFHGSSRPQRYDRIDVAITYTLFVGGIFLEGCAVFVMLMPSPWSWAWLKARGYHRLAGMCMFLLLKRSGGSGMYMGQYSLRSYMGYYYGGQARPRLSHSQRVMVMIRKMASIVGLKRERLFWLSKLLDTEFVPMDDKIMQALLQRVPVYRVGYYGIFGPMLNVLANDFFNLGQQIVALHAFTEDHLSKYHRPDMAAIATEAASSTALELDQLVEECRKLSNYALYLVAAQSSMLQLTTGALPDTRPFFEDRVTVDDAQGTISFAMYDNMHPPASNETLEEMKDMWIQFLRYLAAKSRPEAHAAQLAAGGEPLTLAWLLLAHSDVYVLGRHVEFKEVFPFRADHAH